MKKITIALFALFISVQLFAAPYWGQIHKFNQPDGTLVEVKLYGDEYYMRAEGLDGYTVIRDPQSGWICYAGLSADGMELVSTGIKYLSTRDNPVPALTNLTISKHIQIRQEAILQTVARNKKQTGYDKMEEAYMKGTPYNPVIGNYTGICIVVDFSDEPATLNISEFDELCNGDNYTGFGNNGSIKEYFNDVSNGLVVYENVVWGWFRADKTFAQYDAMAYASGAQEILGDALTWINNQGFDFSTLSIVGGRIMAINLMYTGDPPNWAEGMWYHAGSYNGFSADGVQSQRYNCSPANNPLGIGVCCHENGHMVCRWPDTYKYDSSEDGIGAFDLMCWYGSGSNPVPPNPHFATQAAWTDVIDVTSFAGTINDEDWDDKVYKYEKNGDNSEFFLLKSARQTDRGANYPDQGLTIWHIDTDGDNQGSFHEVYLRHANNNWTNQGGACFDQNVNEFSDNTSPDANWHNGSASGLYVWDVGAAGAIQNYNIGILPEEPPVADFSSSTTNTCNGTVVFTDLSTNYPTSWSWDFGDGNVSSDQNPAHTYSADGAYSVSLTATNGQGSDTEIKSDYITVALVPAPVTTDGYGTAGSSVTLSASGTGTLNWYDQQTGGTLLNTGTTYNTPSLNVTTTYYVEDLAQGSSQYVGPADNSFGDGGYHSGPYGLVFDVIEYVTIKSFTVYANVAGERTINVYDQINGNLLHSLTVNLPQGESRIDLNFNLSPGTDYFINADNNILVDLYRNSSGPGYPYTIDNLVSIKQSNASAPYDYYYYYYDWEIVEDCISERAEVTAHISTSITDIGGEKLLVYPNPGQGIYNLKINNIQGDIDIKITDIQGRNIYTDELFNATGEISTRIDLSMYAEGIYYLRVIIKDKIFNRKIIIAY